jgi:tripartite-type tricarboxylate transporter receptor subunit TctC
MMYGKRTIIVLIGIVFILTGSSSWAADSYPSKTIQLIVPLVAGGAIDLSTRLIAKKMQEYLGQSVIVVNKPGGTGSLGAGFVATSKPDGYTLLSYAGGGGFECLPITHPNVSFKLSDFIPIAAVMKTPQVAIANKGLPVKTFAELVEYVEKHPGTLSYASTGIANYGHLLVELLKLTRNIKFDIQQVPYPGGAPALTAVLGNHCQVGIFTSGGELKHIESGEIRALAVFGKKRSPFLPQVPTIVEQGFPELVAETYFIYYAPAKTPPDIVKKLQDVIAKVIQDKEIVEKMKQLNVTVDFMNSQETQAFLNNSLKKLEPVIRKANIYVK